MPATSLIDSRFPRRMRSKKLLPERMKTRLGSIALVVLRAYRLSSRRAGFALMYHAVDDCPGDPDRELVPTHATHLIEAQLRFVRAHFRLVPASDLVAAVDARRRGERFPLAVTFDDDLPSHVKVALPLLRRLRAPASFFLCGTSLDGPQLFWWQRMQMAFDQGDGLAVRRLVERHGARLPPRWPLTVHELAAAIAELPSSKLDAMDRALAGLVSPPAPDAGLRRGDVQALARAGFEIGFHTLRHYHLSDLDDGPLAEAMREGRDRLAVPAGRNLTSIAYPHGRADRRVATAAREAGFRSGFTARWEPVEPAADPLFLGRIAPSLTSTGQLALQLARSLLTGRAPGPDQSAQDEISRNSWSKRLSQVWSDRARS